MFWYIAGFALAFIITLILTPFLKKIACSVGAYDFPSPRRVNKKPVPNGGGLAIYAGVMITLLLIMPLSTPLKGIMLGGTIILLIGIVDDIRGLSPRVKLLGQIAAALTLIPFGVQIQFVTNPWGGMIFLGNWGILITILWVVGITNTVNFIDGLDGLAAGVCAIASGTLAIVAMQEGQIAAAFMSLIIAGSSLSFLVFNFHPARIFMGDSGAMFLGFMLATTSTLGALKSATAMTLIVPILALGVPIADTLLAILRRSKNGHPISLADKDHIHHRLIRAGFSHRGAVLAVYGTSILLGIMAVVINTVQQTEWFLLLLLLLSVLGYAGWRLGIFRLTERAEQNITRLIR